jgi:predicted nucleotidyltransferase
VIKVGPIEIEDRKLAEVCRRYNVGQLAVFGSAARGEARPESDIDVLVEFLPESKVGLLDYTGLMLDLSDLFGRKVDLVSKRGLKPLLRDSILREARPFYAA